MAEFKDCIRSLIPGRLRLRHSAVKGMDEATQQMVRDWLLGLKGVYQVTINPTVGSVLVLWRERLISTKTVLETLEGAASMMVGMVPELPEPTECEIKLDRTLRTVNHTIGKLAVKVAGAGNHSLKFIARRVTNRFMMGALGVSIFALGWGGIGAHVLFGTAFLGVLGVHLWQHQNLV